MPLYRVPLCDNCLQYEEDCECCPVCKETDYHLDGCAAAQTRKSAAVPKSVPKPQTSNKTMMSPAFPTSQPQCVVEIDPDAVGTESTGNSRRG